MVFFTFAWYIGLSLFAFGLFIGAVAPTFGIGGGLVTVPILILVYHFAGETATATSLGLIFFTSLSGTIAYIREKKIDFKVALSFIIFAVPGAISGGLLSRYLKEINVKIDIFQIIFAVTMMLIAIYKITTILIAKKKKRTEANTSTIANDIVISQENINENFWQRLIRKYTTQRRIVDRNGREFNYTAKIFPGLIIAALGGFIGAILGLGGGVIYVPILTLIIGVPALIATATSTFTILIANPFGVALRWSSIQWDYVICLAFGTVISANLVPKFLGKVKSELILAGFWILVIFAGIRLILRVSGVAI